MRFYGTSRIAENTNVCKGVFLTSIKVYFNYLNIKSNISERFGSKLQMHLTSSKVCWHGCSGMWNFLEFRFYALYKQKEVVLLERWLPSYIELSTNQKMDISKYEHYTTHMYLVTSNLTLSRR